MTTKFNIFAFHKNVTKSLFSDGDYFAQMTTKFCIFTVYKKVAGSFFQIVRQRSLREISGSDRDDLLDEHHRGFNAILLFSFVTDGAAK
jgi:hypothetical protein